MRIYSMTATFGKLNNQTLTLKPGLNVIHAPNEWGKSTWCAFLLNMLYGVDTKERTTMDSVADKDRYAPWSGAAMSGKIDLSWQGKNITIERSSNQRVPMGNFRAYETETGIDIPELTAANCGQTLLGVERNVFVRAGFLKMADLPVTQNDALRRRLNNLVTTGDESDDADKLRQALKDLKNKCRSNRANGLLPEAEAEHTKLKEQLWELQELTGKNQQLDSHKKDLEQQIAALQNHQVALAYEAAKADAQKVADAKLALANAQNRLAQLQEAVKDQPTLEDAQAACKEAAQLQTQQDLLLREQQQLPERPVAPAVPSCFKDMTPAEAMDAVQKDTQACATLEAARKKQKSANMILGLLALLLGCGLLVGGVAIGSLRLPLLIAGAVLMALGAVIMLVNAKNSKKTAATLAQIHSRYPGLAEDAWLQAAEKYAQDMQNYEDLQRAYDAQTGGFAQRWEAHQAWLAAFAGEQTLQQRQHYFEDAAYLWQELDRAQRELEQAKHHAETLEGMVKTVPAPEFADTLTQSARETEFALAQAKLELARAGESIAQNNGRMDSIGHPGAIRAKLEQVSQRISRLETYYSAIELAQDYLYKTTLTLQRRFAPRITKRTQELFSKLTGGRYQRITIGEDMGLEAAAADEVTLRELRRRSDGTMDQLYLALRLAVAGELTPQAPLILDDALVRFDDDRLKQAMALLEEEAENKQVILFTCQSREENCISGQEN